MLIAIIGENCSGKSTLAAALGSVVGAEILSGKDYLRFAKSESEARIVLRKKLEAAVTGEPLIYVISESEQLAFLPSGTVKIQVYADLDTIKERFKERMHGNLPAPVAQMLERKHGSFDSGEYAWKFDGGQGDIEAFCARFQGLYVPRRLSQSEVPAAKALIWDVFTEFEAPDYSPEGIAEFQRCLQDEAYLTGIEYYGAFDGDKLVAVLGWRARKQHICFFFTDKSYQRKGIGTALMQTALQACTQGSISVNASPYGVPFYRMVGFTATDTEQSVKGIKFIPMQRSIIC